VDEVFRVVAVKTWTFHIIEELEADFIKIPRIIESYLVKNHVGGDRFLLNSGLHFFSKRPEARIIDKMILIHCELVTVKNERNRRTPIMVLGITEILSRSKN
jgi:hypothetical protein